MGVATGFGLVRYGAGNDYLYQLDSNLGLGSITSGQGTWIPQVRQLILQLIDFIDIKSRFLTQQTKLGRRC
jgi:hypothetical protein